MKKKEQDIPKSLIMITQIGISMLVPIFLSLFIGIKLDSFFFTSYWFIVFLIIGIAASFRNVYLLTRKFYSKDLEKEEKEQEYFKELMKNRKEDR